MNQTKFRSEDNGDFEPQDLQEVVVDTSERLSDLISKGVSDGVGGCEVDLVSPNGQCRGPPFFLL